MEGSSRDYKMQYLNSKIRAHDVPMRFVELKTHEERFALALEAVLCSSPVLLDFKCDEKDSDHSKRLRNAGNKSYLNSQYYTALQEYTESILYALNSSEELAVAYANRSAALYKLEKYNDCIKDIDRALNLKYPDRLKTKLYKRRGLCLMALGKPNADSSLKEALIWLDKMSLTNKERTENETELKNLISIPYSSTKQSNNSTKDPEPKILSPNPKIPCASDAVTIKYSERYGRHVVATRKIKPGEILTIEEPYCKRLITKHVYTNCSYCFYASWSMIPCNGCVNVAYCSETCRDKAWEKYHEIECSIGGMLQYLNVNDHTCLGLRMAIMATKKGKKLNALREELIIVEQNPDPCTSLYCDDGIFRHDDYRSIHCSKVNTSNETPWDRMISDAVWAAVSVCILATQSEIFGKKLEFQELAENPADVIFMGGLILKHLHLGAQIKTHKIGSVNGPVPVDFGQSLMAIGSLFNHSCDANTARQFNPDKMMIFAIHPIEEGEQLFDNYGHSDFTTMKKTQRLENFNRWKFNCECRACTENWPTFEGLRSYKQQPLISQTKQKVDKIVQTVKRCKSLMQKGTKKEPNTFNELVKMIESLFTLVKRPSKELMLATQLLKLYYTSDVPILDYQLTTKFIAESQRDFMFSQLKLVL